MQVTGKAAKLLDGLKITSANYQVAKELLHEEYGSTQIVTNKLYNDINNLSLVSQKKEDIMKLYSDIETNLKLLENLGNQVEGEVLASCIFKKLAPETKSKLVELYSDKITVSNIRVRMKEELKQQRVLQSLEPCSSVSSKPPPSPHKFGGFQYEKKGYTAESLVARASDSGGGGNNRTIGHCVFCDTQGHFSDECPTYQTIVDRKKMLDRKCHICLRLNHSTPQCRNMARCYHCGVRGSHYRALCPSKFPRGNIQVQNPSNRYNRPNFRNSYPTDNNNSRGSVSNQKNPPVNQQQNTSAHMNDSQETGVVSTSLYSGNSSSPSVVYFQTATIRVKNKENGKECKVRALFDSGSTYSYITESLKNRLDLGHGGESVNLNMYTFGTDVPKSMNVGKCSVTLLDSQDNPRDIDVCVVPTIIHNHSRSPYDVSFISSLGSKYELADKYFSGRKEDSLDIDLLIGSDYYSSFIRGVPIEIDRELYLLESSFGFILNGKYRGNTDSSDDSHVSNFIAYHLFTRTEMPLQDIHDIKQFWSLETLGIKDNYSISSDDLALESFEKTLNYDKENKMYFVSFPWVNDSRDLPSNYGIAIGCLKSLAKRHKGDGILKTCEDTFNDQMKRGVLEEVEPGDKVPCHYLPYHAVVRQESETTKVRFVMNASCKSGKNSHSLNDMLYRGPVLLENLGSLLLRFRMHKYGVIADIEKAFLCIGLNEEDRDFTRIVWVKDINKDVTDDNIKILRHARIPFGVSSSPFLLGAVISTHLAKYTGDIPAKLNSDIYVDNLVTGVGSEDELEKLVVTSREIFSQAGLNLRSWCTSVKHSSFYEGLDPKITSSKEVQNVLGVGWDTSSDTLTMKLSFHYDNQQVNKRLLLSAYSSFYDMLGLWSPILIALKILIQKAWTENKSWDEQLSVEDSDQFIRIVSDVEKAAEFPIPRNINLHMTNVRYELHAFSDACISSYSAAVYLKCIQSGGSQVNLLFAKVRVAPKEKPTLPRLELLGALLAYRCLKYVDSSLHTTIDNYYLWCDNMSVLHWILGNKVLPTFINNRVKEIRSSNFHIDFRYIASENNPADILCRGKNFDSLIRNELYWHGPKFLLLDKEQWPETPIITSHHVPSDLNDVEVENKSEECVNMINNRSDIRYHVQKPIPIDETKYRSFHVIVNITCYVRKFIRICRGDRDAKGPIAYEDYLQSQRSWLSYLQFQSCKPHITSLLSGRKDNTCIQLGLELNDHKILVCKGRFVEVPCNSSEKFPIYLPRNNYLASTIIYDVHKRNLHTGVSQTLARLREEYWVSQGRAEVRSVLKKCVTCKRFSVNPYKMPDFSILPNFRVNQNISFSYVGMDYFGPLYVKDNPSGGISPVYGLIFTCLTTRAVHLELTQSESGTDLVLAFRRFIARRGNIIQLLCDNAMSFKLLENVTNSLYDNLNSKKIKFTYISPLHPWQGGAYERIIGIVKQCLKKTIGKLMLTSVQLNTILIEVENIVNARPLGYYGEEDMIITPNHFLGIKRDTLTSQDGDYTNDKAQSLTFRKVADLWKKGNSYLELFWRHWSKQYICSLRERKKVMFSQGKVNSLDPKVGEVVLIREGYSGPYDLSIVIVPSIKFQAILLNSSKKELKFQKL
ncbi:hypothetical protein M8J77_005435 [Diaphorina citri]|nr:hypothetical protein M8J77_005435 [Diaphorina citri]